MNIKLEDQFYAPWSYNGVSKHMTKTYIVLGFEYAYDLVCDLYYHEM